MQERLNELDLALLSHEEIYSLFSSSVKPHFKLYWRLLITRKDVRDFYCSIRVRPGRAWLRAANVAARHVGYRLVLENRILVRFEEINHERT